MSRLTVWVALVALLVIHPSVAAAQSIPAILTRALPIHSEVVDVFEKALNADVTRYDMKSDTLAGRLLAAELNKQRPPIVLALGSSAARVADREIDEGIPVVFCMVADPEAAGLLGSSHSTGVSLGVPLSIQLGTLKSVLPGVRTVAVVYDSSATTHIMEEAVFIAADFDLKIHPVPVTSEEQVVEAVRELPESVDVLWAVPDVMVLSHAQEVIDAANAKRLPVLAPARTIVGMGALLALSPDYHDTGRQAAELARKVLLGVKPRDLPIEAPSSFHLVVNKDTANLLNVEVPKSLIGITVEYE